MPEQMSEMEWGCVGSFPRPVAALRPKTGTYGDVPGLPYTTDRVENWFPLLN